MERDDQYYRNNYTHHQHGSGDNADQYRERYSQHGNYYGMSGSGREYGNVRMQQRSDFNDFSAGPVGGYGAGNYNDTHRNRDDHYRYGDDSHFRQSHGYSGQGDYRSDDYRNRQRMNEYRQNDRSSNRDNYSYSSDPESGYGVAGNRRYARQENSYQRQGQGKRYDQYGQDERYNYGHELTDIHHDRGSSGRSWSDNNYGRNYNPRNDWDFDDNREDYRYSGRIEESNSNRNSDTYANGPYASNRAYVSDHSDSDGERYSSRDRRSGERSGPDYSARSSISNYGYQTFGI